MQLVKYHQIGTVCPKKRLPFEVKRWCRMFEFECFNSLMSPRLRKLIRKAYKKFSALTFYAFLGSLGP